MDKNFVFKKNTIGDLFIPVFHLILLCSFLSWFFNMLDFDGSPDGFLILSGRLEMSFLWGERWSDPELCSYRVNSQPGWRVWWLWQAKHSIINEQNWVEIEWIVNIFPKFPSLWGLLLKILILHYSKSISAAQKD